MMRMVTRINGELLPAITTVAPPPIEVQCITCHPGAQRPLMLENTLGAVIGRLGVDSALVTYERIKAALHGADAYNFGQQSLNTLAARPMEQNRLADVSRRLTGRVP